MWVLGDVFPSIEIFLGVNVRSLGERIDSKIPLVGVLSSKDWGLGGVSAESNELCWF